jgi:peptidyl-tRNA hydrolase, PTH1 family
MPGLRALLGKHRAQAGHEGAAGAPVAMIVGLGNPGPEYARHRHNIGFQVLDLFAARHGLEFDKFQKRARLALGTVSLPGGWRGRVLLAKPMTYMNSSGEAVGPLAAFYKIPAERVLVAHDDLDLPLGRLRLRANGSPGGQKGVASVIRSLGTDGFGRLKIGISRPGGQNSGAPPAMDPADYVLQPFSADQEKEMALARDRALDAIEAWLSQGIEAAMNSFNAEPAGKS